MEYFDDPHSENEVMADHIVRSGVQVRTRQTSMGLTAQSFRPSLPPTPSYMMPRTPYGDTYTPSYTRYQNAPGASYVNPMHVIFNDRRPAIPPIRTTLFPTKGA